jgi:hypothetical protein
MVEQLASLLSQLTAPGFRWSGWPTERGKSRNTIFDISDYSLLSGIYGSLGRVRFPRDRITAEAPK